MIVGDVRGALHDAQQALHAQLTEISELRNGGHEVWPVIEFRDLANEALAGAARAAARHRGCVVVRGTFARDRAVEWDLELSTYLHPLRARPEFCEPIVPAYWSPPQLEARSDDRLMDVYRFLGSCWGISGRDALADPISYPDRVRRSSSGTAWVGLQPHIDGAFNSGWTTAAHLTTYRRIYERSIGEHDPWSFHDRDVPTVNDVTPIPAAFRAFQGWTALAAMEGGAGSLHVVPEPSAIKIVLIAAIQHDVDEAHPRGSQSLPVPSDRHRTLLSALTSIPPVEPGDTVWWHPDLIHSVPPIAQQRTPVSLMYIPFAPRCRVNEVRAAINRISLRKRTSPLDFEPTSLEQDH